MYVLTLLDTIFKEKATPIESHCQELDHISVSTSTQNDLKFVQTPIPRESPDKPCAVPGCTIAMRRNEPLLSYHRFPTDKSLEPICHQWTQILLPILPLSQSCATDLQKRHICSRHFLATDFASRGIEGAILSPTAIPSQHLDGEAFMEYSQQLCIKQESSNEKFDHDNVQPVNSGHQPANTTKPPTYVYTYSIESSFTQTVDKDPITTPPPNKKRIVEARQENHSASKDLINPTISQACSNSLEVLEIVQDLPVPPPTDQDSLKSPQES
ncbi:DNA transposase THAP9 [Folsomia candida]|uniref:DNA transposase THAP9 n=1 Tax=Folsomia candida TaxID=158441 RepID=A0A226D0R0_FOLCA|nr:DNA transposase THAP9 [Folsomia candida]